MDHTITLILPVVVPAVSGIAIAVLPALRENSRRQAAVLSSLFLTLLVTVVCLCMPEESAYLFSLAPGWDIVFAVDSITRLFAGIMAFMFLMSGTFSIEYFRHEKNHNRYYSLFLLTESAMLGTAFAANYITMYVCFEWTTLCAVFLVLHTQKEEAIRASIKYFLYSFAGALAGMLAVPFIHHYGTTFRFTAGGVLDSSLIQGHESLLLVIAFFSILGFGAKAGLFPLHAWLPAAHPVAPAPAHAILSGVITKAGVIAIVRVIYYIFGADFLSGTWVQTLLLSIALLTVFMGSAMALRENILKKRLAYSTVSQVSYILFGLFLMNRTALTGSMLHVLCHCIVKDGIFLSAGAVIYKTERLDVRQLRGIGKEMPVVLWCFTLCSLGLVGIPPMCGYLSKWYLALGSLECGIPVISWLGPVILLVSALFTAAYLLSISIHGFFPGSDYDYASLEKKDPTAWMLVPLILIAVLSAFTLYPRPFMALVEGVTSALM